MRFHDPFLLLALPFVILAVVFALRQPRARFRYSNILLVRDAIRGSLNPKRILGLLRVVTLCLFVFALARPQSGRKFTEIASEGVDIMLALDTSGSMQALDLKLDGQPAPRVDVVKHVASEFIARRTNDRVGMVIFAESAFVQCPLTLDHNILDKLLDEVHLGVAGDSTAIGDAIGVAVNHMKDLKAKSKVIILLTDGESNSGVLPPLKAAELAKTFNIKIYTIGVGIEGEAPFLVDTPLGKRVMYQRADLDEKTLKSIADITGAKFFRAQDTETLKRVYTEIDGLEKSEVKVKEYSEYNELFAWFLIPALLLLVGEITLGQTYLRKIP